MNKVSLRLAFSIAALCAMASHPAFADLPPRSPLLKHPVDLDPIASQSYRVAVKFKDSSLIRIAGSTATSLAGENVSVLQQFINTHQLTFVPQVNLSSTVIEAFELEAEAGCLIQQPDFGGMFLITFATTSTPIREQIANDLQALGQVEYVDAAVNLVPPPGDIFPTTPSFDSMQTFFGTLPGIDVNYAISQNLLGQGMRYADIEYCWLNNHEDFDDVLQSEANQPPDTSLDPAFCDHGAAAAGELSARHNAYGTRGMVPSATVFVHPVYVAGQHREAAAMISAHQRTLAGDALMLEIQAILPGQDGHGPAELENSIFLATQSAVCAGRVVVAAAGNGIFNAQNLDSPAYANWRARGR